MTIIFERLEHAMGVAMPDYASDEAAGMDVRSAINGVLLPGERALFPTGFKAQIPTGYELQVRPRSGLALKHGVTVLNTPGTIDSDYRGEIGVVLINHGQEPFLVKSGDRIAQLVLARVERMKVRDGYVDDTERGEGGFGSTGVG